MTDPARPLALVYRGPAALPHCPESAAALLRTHPLGFDVRYVGDHEKLRLTRSVLADAALYVQPGGGELESAWQHMRKHRHPIRAYVAAGGRYLGLCLGGYLAGHTPGFDLLPGDTDQYIASPTATISGEDPAIVRTRWRSGPADMYFQDGPMFVLDDEPDDRSSGSVGADVLARYRSGEIAALTSDFGNGRVAVCGPHPEAGVDWFVDDGLRPVDATAVGHDLLDALMASPTASESDGDSRSAAPLPKRRKLFHRKMLRRITCTDTSTPRRTRTPR